MRGGSNTLISPNQAARQLGISRDTVDRHWREWGWTKRKLGDSRNSPVRFRQRDIDNYNSRNQVTA